MFTTVNCSCCNKNFSYLHHNISKITKIRIKTLLSDYEFEMKKDLESKIEYICMNCFSKYKLNPVMLDFELKIGII